LLLLLQQMLEPERRQRWFEVCIVLVVTCGILIVNAVYLSANGQGSAPRVSGQHRAEGQVLQESSPGTWVLRAVVASYSVHEQLHGQFS